MSQRIRAALYIDFDNLFSGLVAIDPVAAEAFASKPEKWLNRLRYNLDGDEYRDFLVLRCYLNPAGWVAKEDSLPAPRQRGVRYERRNRVEFTRYRAFLTAAGFDVIDCPTLTAGGKNAADIRITLDIVAALSHSTRFDEFVLFSGDSDFTPLVQRVREFDRRTTVVSTANTPRAYSANVDTFIDAPGFLSIVLDPEPEPPVEAKTEGDEASPGSTAVSARNGAPFVASEYIDISQHQAGREAVVQRAVAIIEAAREPVSFATLGARLHDDFGEVLKATNWFGHRTMWNAIDTPAVAHLRRSEHHIWDPVRHRPPGTYVDEETAALPTIVSQVATVTGIPRLSSEAYKAIFRAEADALASGNFSLDANSHRIRYRLQEELDLDVSPSRIKFVLLAPRLGNAYLSTKPSAADISGKFFDYLMEACEAAQLQIGDEDQKALTDWFLVSDDDSTAPAAADDMSAPPEETPAEGPPAQG